MLYSDQPGFSLVIVFPVGSAWCIVQWSTWVQSGYCFPCRVCLTCCTVISLGSVWLLFCLRSAWCIVQWSTWVQSGYCFPCTLCLTCCTVISLGSVWLLFCLRSAWCVVQWSTWVQSGYCFPCRVCLTCCTVISLGSVWLLFCLRSAWCVVQWSTWVQSGDCFPCRWCCMDIKVELVIYILIHSIRVANSGMLVSFCDVTQKAVRCSCRAVASSRLLVAVTSTSEQPRVRSKLLLHLTQCIVYVIQ